MVKLSEQVSIISMDIVRSVELGTPGREAIRAWAAGSTDFITQYKFGFLCSSQCPGSIVLKTLDAVRQMRDDKKTLISGFHSVLESECLKILLRGRQPIIWAPARSIVGMRLKSELRPAFREGRLLLLSPFRSEQNRVTAKLAADRNRFVGTLAETIFVPHAAPASRTFEHCKELALMGKSIVTIDDPLNDPLLRLKGVRRFQ